VKPFLTFRVKYLRRDRIERVKCYHATNPGSAYDKCNREYPSAQLLDCWRQSEGNGEKAVTHYPPPSTIRLPAEPPPNEKQELFGFVDASISFKPPQTDWNGGDPMDTKSMNPSDDPRVLWRSGL
jgi:hypothetical protein